MCFRDVFVLLTVFSLSRRDREFSSASVLPRVLCSCGPQTLPLYPDNVLYLLTYVGTCSTADALLVPVSFSCSPSPPPSLLLLLLGHPLRLILSPRYVNVQQRGQEVGPARSVPKSISDRRSLLESGWSRVGEEALDASPNHPPERQADSTVSVSLYCASQRSRTAATHSASQKAPSARIDRTSRGSRVKLREAGGALLQSESVAHWYSEDAPSYPTVSSTCAAATSTVSTASTAKAIATRCVCTPLVSTSSSTTTSTSR